MHSRSAIDYCWCLCIQYLHRSRWSTQFSVCRFSFGQHLSFFLVSWRYETCAATTLCDFINIIFCCGFVKLVIQFYFFLASSWFCDLASFFLRWCLWFACSVKRCRWEHFRRLPHEYCMWFGWKWHSVANFNAYRIKHARAYHFRKVWAKIVAKWMGKLTQYLGCDAMMIPNEMHKHISICIMLAPSHHLQDVMCVFCDYMLWYVCARVCFSLVFFSLSFLLPCQVVWVTGRGRWWNEFFLFSFASSLHSWLLHLNAIAIVNVLLLSLMPGSLHIFQGLVDDAAHIVFIHRDFDALSKSSSFSKKVNCKLYMIENKTFWYSGIVLSTTIHRHWAVPNQSAA